MVEQNTFLETLNSVKEIMKTSAVAMKEDEILSYFKDMDLDGAQKAMVIDYLKNPANFEEETDVAFNNASADKQAEKIEEGGVDVYQMYLDELDGLKTYSSKELLELYRLLLQGDSSVIEKISHAWLLPVTEIAKQYQEPKILLEDLVQEGNMALFLELSRLCGSMEKSDVEETLKNAVEAGIMEYAGRMRNEKESEETVVGKINLLNAAKSILTEENGQVPTMKELADYTKMSEKELSELSDIIEEVKDKP